MLLGTAAAQHFAVLEDLVLLSLQLEVESCRAKQGKLYTMNLAFHLCKMIRVHGVQTPGLQKFGMK